MLILRGSPALSPFRIQSLIQGLTAAGVPVRGLAAEFVHLAETDGLLDPAGHAVLEKLLTYGPRRSAAAIDGLKQIVAPRPGTMSPWSSKATEIAHTCGRTAVRRPEELVDLLGTSQRAVAALRQADAADRAAVITYSLADHRRLFALAPDLVVSATAETLADVNALLASGLDLSRVVAWTGVGVPDPEVVARLHAAGIRAQAGAFGAIDEAARTTASPAPYDAILAAGADVIATDVVPMAALATRNAALIRRARR